MTTATKATHTPGPWTLEPGYLVITGCNGRITVCEIHDHSSTGDGSHDLAEAQINACLIAAAPEMLELLEDYISGAYTDAAAGLTEAFDVAVREAIRKARGEK